MLVVEGKYALDFYFTRNTLPFGVREKVSEQESKKICN